MGYFHNRLKFGPSLKIPPFGGLKQKKTFNKFVYQTTQNLNHLLPIN
jgi:hypothetical protein